MNSRRTTKDKPPAILHGARALALLSLIWSGYAITDLMHSGPFGVSVALAGDIGWLTVLWAEYRGIPLFGWRHAAPTAGWLIAISVGVLLVIHGAEHSLAQAIAGPLVVFVGKIAWAFALAALKDPTAPTPEQLAELHAELRDTAHETALLQARAKGRIDRIKAEASVTLVRDETDFEITLERIDKQAEIHRRTPIALTASPPPAEQPAAFAEQVREQPNTTTNAIASDPITIREQVANNGPASTNTVPEPPSIADLVREQLASTTNNAEAVRNIMTARPDANRGSVAATVRRERRRLNNTQGYA
ncbi:hypothetical protein AB0C88_37705 [Streptomyces chartreusis]|uniref:hypothetical protein n=1 Tax=Streptomyces chartreusis TaxID=1969 RepID=UPI0033D1F624